MPNSRPTLPYQAPTFDPAREHSSESMNHRIDTAIQSEVFRVSQGGRHAIVDHMNKLDREWDLDRVVTLYYAITAGGALFAGMKLSRKWLSVSGVQILLLGFNATRGWCPSTFLFRRFGLRTQKEIQAERLALLRILEQGAQSASSSNTLPA